MKAGSTRQKSGEEGIGQQGRDADRTGEAGVQGAGVVTDLANQPGGEAAENSGVLWASLGGLRSLGRWGLGQCYTGLGVSCLCEEQ